ncbi:MAG: exo-beta-N-acetylmuramidase NamZ family protein, partial [Gemmatimonadales bacterium]
GGYRLTALFSPEHGFRGLEDRPGLPDDTDSASGLPIYSLYGGTPRSRLAALDSIDAVLIDLQDIGARYYTYYSSATQLMREAARRGKPIIVLDRPNPVGGEAVQGNVRDSAGDPDSEFVGFLPIPMRHGMTLGELLRLANETLRLDAGLTVVPAAGWRRGSYFDATGLRWVMPSPNMPDLESALHYPGTCLFEGTNLSVGRGTEFAFQVVAAPWLDPGRVLRQLRQGDGEGGTPPPGVELSATAFTPHAPTDGKYDGIALQGIRLRVTNRRLYDPTRTALALLAAVRAVHPDSLRFKERSFDRLAAGWALREAILAGRASGAIWRSWEPALARFRGLRAKYLLY